MDRDEVRALIQELREFELKMQRDDLFDFQMLKKREQDDEDFDRLSRRRLEELHKKYVVKRIVKDIDQMLKKYSQQVKDFGPGKKEEG
jgi:hypothetical protein